MRIDDVQFPADLTWGFRGGPMMSTTVLMSNSGFEQRNINWALSKGKYNVGHILKDDVGRAELLAFFKARMGMENGFRFKDWMDYQVDLTNGRLVDNGDGTFQLAKLYSDAAGSYLRRIYLPCSGLVADATGHLPPVPVLTGGGSIDTATGIVAGGSAGGTWSGEFDVPVRFGSDVAKLILVAFNDTDWPAIELSELKVAPITVGPSIPPIALMPDLVSVSVVPNPASHGTSATVTVFLSEAVPTGRTMTVYLTSSNSAFATVPATITIAAGNSSGSGTVGVLAAGTVVIRASVIPEPPVSVIPYLSAPIIADGWSSGAVVLAAQGAFNFFHSPLAPNPVPPPQFVLGPPSLYWVGAVGQNTQMLQLDANGGVIQPARDTGHYENWEAAIMATIHVLVPGQYQFALSHDDGAFWAIGDGAVKISGGLTDAWAHDATAELGFTNITGTNTSGSHVDVSVWNFPVAGNYRLEIDWTNWEHASLMRLQCNGRDLVQGSGFAGITTILTVT